MKKALVCVGLVALATLFSSTPLAAQDTWELLDAGTTQDLYAVHFVSADTGYVAGAAGTILKTTDGGLTWEDVSLAVSRDLYDVHFFDADTGVAVGSQGVIVRTEDGGATWAPVPSGTSETLYSVSFADSVGLAGGSNQDILRSEDQGATWTVVQSGFFGGGFFGADMVDDAVGFVVGENSIFQCLVGFTSNGGATFDFAIFYLDGNEGQLEGVHFFDALRGVAVGATFDAQGAVSRSEDGGQTWTTTLFPNALYDVAFATEETGYAVGAGGTILKTTDGGQTWTPEVSGTAETLYAVSLPTPATGYAAGSAGTALKGTISTGTPVVDDVALPPYALEQNHPNPFDRRTVIRYSLPEGEHVTLRVYDTLGHEVAVLVHHYQAPGRHEVAFDASRLSAGLYLYRLEAGAFASTRSMLRLK